MRQSEGDDLGQNGKAEQDRRHPRGNDETERIKHKDRDMALVPAMPWWCYIAQAPDPLDVSGQKCLGYGQAGPTEGSTKAVAAPKGRVTLLFKSHEID